MSFRILHIASGDFFSTYGGGQVYVKNIVDEMISQHIDSGILSTVDKHQSCHKANYKGVPIYEVNPFSTETDLISIIRDFNPTIIHTHSRESEFATIAKKLDIPVVVTSHHGGIVCPAGSLMDTDDHICNTPVCHKNCLKCELKTIRTGCHWYPLMKFVPERAYYNLGRYLSKKKFIPLITPIGSAAYYIRIHKGRWTQVCDNSDIVIAPCQSIADSMILNGLDKSIVRILPHGIPLPAEIPAFPKIETGKIKFFYVGRMCYVKGLHILLKAFHAIDNPAIELHMIGGAGNKNETRYLAKLQHDYRTDSRIIWHGKIPPEEIFNTTKDFHVACAPAIYLEVFGLNIAEALALGKPVLSTRNGGGEAQI